MTTLSVFLSCYNDRARLEKALPQLVPQIDPRCGLVVVDDGSTDGSDQVAQAAIDAQPDRPVRLWRNTRNRGINFRMNEALNAVDSPYIAFAACDDQLYPGALSTLLSLAQAHPDAAMATAPAHIVGDSSAPTGVSLKTPARHEPGFIPPDRCIGQFFDYGHWIMSNTTIFRVEALRASGGFDPDLGPFADGYTTMLLACRHGVAYDPEPQGAWRRATASYSGGVRSNAALSLNLLDRVNQRLLAEVQPKFSAAFIHRFGCRWRFNLAWDLLTQQHSDVAGARAAADDVVGPLGQAALHLADRFGYRGVFGKLLYADMRPFDIPSRVARGILGR